MVTARPASLQAYRQVARDAGGDLRADRDRLAEAVDAARRSAVDVPLPSIAVEVVADLERLGSDLEVFGGAVGRVGDAFEDLEAGPVPVVRTTETELAERLGPFAGVSGPMALATGLLRWHAVQLPLSLANLGLAAQRTRMLAEMAGAWARREWLRVTTPLRATVTGMSHLLTGRWRTLVPSVQDTLRQGREAAVRQTTRLHDSLDRARTGWGTVGRVGRVLGPVGMAGDVHTAALGSRYDGARGTTDRVMAGVGIVAGATLLAAGTVALSPVIVTAAVVGTVAATAWGVGNLAWDHRHTLADWTRRGAGAVADGASAVASTVRRGAASAGAAVGSAAKSATRAVGSAASSVGDGLRGAGRVLGFGG